MRPPRPIRSRAATSTTTRGHGSTTPTPAMPSRAGTHAIRCTAGPRTSPSLQPWGSGPIASPSSGAGSSPPRASSPQPHWTITAGSARPAANGNIVPVVTFHHFTTPTWLNARGGWEAADAPEIFARFVARAGAHLGDLIGWACTINELNLIGVRGYDLGSSSSRCEGQLCPPPGGQRSDGASTSSGRRRLAVGPGRLPRRPDVVHGRDGGRPGRGERARSSPRDPGGHVSFGPPRATISSVSSATRVCTSVPRARLPTSRECPPPRWATSTGPRGSSTAPGERRP